MKRFIKPLLAIAFVAMLAVGINQVVESEHKIQIQNVEIKSKTTELIELQHKFNDLNKKYDDSGNNVEQLNKEREDLLKEKQRLEAELQAKLDSKAKEAERLASAANQATATQAASAQPVVNISGTKQDWMRAAGIPESDWWAVDYIVSKESSWNPSAVNPNGGATGLCQALPASKMATAGEDYLTSPVTQLRWCDGYAKSRYGGWSGAYSAWLSQHWW